jgi:uncharacterized protein YbaR (Trm112 family)
MRIVDCRQGTDAWHRARLGLPTASKIGAVITPTGKETKGAGRKTYALELVAERITGKETKVFVSDAMERGKLLEQAAREWYRINVGPVEEIGFCLADEIDAGCSPDGVVGVDGAKAEGGIEVKCPLIKHYLEILESGEIPSDWLMQIHDCMYVTGAQWWDFVLYTDVEPFGGWVKRVHRDTDMMVAMDTALRNFCAEVDATEQTIRERIAEHKFTRVAGYDWTDTWMVGE